MNTSWPDQLATEDVDRTSFGSLARSTLSTLSTAAYDKPDDPQACSSPWHLIPGHGQDAGPAAKQDTNAMNKNPFAGDVLD
jgi:hypothetical protein